MTVSLPEAARNLLDAKTFATVATVRADGGPHTSVVWVTREGDAVLFSTTKERLKSRNLARDPRISISIFALENPYHTFEIRGSAEQLDDPTGALPVELSRKYTGGDPPPDPEGVERVIIRVTPEKVIEFSP